MTVSRRAVLSGLSGILLGLAFPGSGGQAWLAFVGLVPLLVAIEGESWRRAATMGFVAGLVFWLWTIPWLALTLVRYGGAPWPLAGLVLIGLVGYLASYTAAFCGLLAQARSCPRGFYVLVAASLWVALELLRTYLLTGFPWNLLGYSQYRNLALIQVAAATGVYGVSFVVVAVNGALARLVLIGRRWTEVLAPVGTAGAALGLALAGGWLWPAWPASAPTVPVAVVQGSIDQGVKWDPGYQDRALAVYRDLTLSAARLGPRPWLAAAPSGGSPRWRISGCSALICSSARSR